MAWLFQNNAGSKIKVRSTTGFRIGGELAYYFNCVDGPNYNGPYPQKQNERFGYRTSIQGKELVIAITARMSVSLGDII